MKKEQRMTRRAFLKRSALAVLGLAVSGGAYARFWEPEWLETTRLTLQSSRLPAAFSGMRIIQFSDVHFGFHMDADDLQKLVNRIQREQADMICFTGDLIDGASSDARKALPILKQLRAPLGQYAVLGNHDFRGFPGEVVTGVLQRSGFEVLHNRHMQIQRGGQQIAVAGVEDWFGGNPDIQEAIRGIPPEEYTLLLAHEPDLADEAKEYSIDLQLSGHSHGGQIFVPLIGAPWNPAMGRKYPRGLYQFNNQQFSLYTNRGIGMTMLPLRLLSRPELTVITLQSIAK